MSPTLIVTMTIKPPQDNSTPKKPTPQPKEITPPPPTGELSDSEFIGLSGEDNAEPQVVGFDTHLVVVFSNEYPIKEKLSVDRWRVYTIMLLDDNQWELERDESYNQY